MISRTASLVLDIITAICLASLILSSLIVLFKYSYVFSNDYYFKLAFLTISCVFQIISPWVKFTQVYFKFMTSPFWRSGFVFMLGMFLFPSFQSIYWQLGAFVFQNVCAILVMFLANVHLVVAIVDCSKKNTYEQYSDVNEA
ncbi:Hypothetical_protein [Hexamita inflata]|uniref:Hypothetical_protein n=1 Tax=Hexamita inflata TaxID=28002 RepID=A0AA86PF50_9EUKA|nr:Hypothetical protein HINF_LOCUS25093 [Hexamita inflata]